LSSLGNAILQGAMRLHFGPHPQRARRDAETLLLHILGKDRTWLMTHGDGELSVAEAGRFAALIERRYSGEPVQYIVGENEFYGLPFRVTDEVLIPRPETEHLVEKVIELAGRFPQARIVDVGTGSGAIAIALAHALGNAQITGVDISAAALEVARENATLNGVADRIDFRKSDLLTEVAGGRFEIVASNPPYVPLADRDSLAVEVREHEPALALFAGLDGLSVYRRLIPAAHAALMPEGFLVMEIGFGQSHAVHALLAGAGFEQVEFTADLQGIPRVACARRAATPES
jgi:release factor glutamine methyltransferase